MASTDIALIYAGRVLVGLGVGTITAAAPVFIAEVSPPAIRGQLVGFCELRSNTFAFDSDRLNLPFFPFGRIDEIAYQVGAVVGFWINYGLKRESNGSLESCSSQIELIALLVPLSHSQNIKTSLLERPGGFRWLSSSFPRACSSFLSCVRLSTPRKSDSDLSLFSSSSSVKLLGSFSSKVEQTQLCLPSLSFETYPPTTPTSSRRSQPSSPKSRTFPCCEERKSGTGSGHGSSLTGTGFGATSQPRESGTEWLWVSE